ncbi:hypothetical protein [Nocardia sp. IFM 10818]
MRTRRRGDRSDLTYTEVGTCPTAPAEGRYGLAARAEAGGGPAAHAEDGGSLTAHAEVCPTDRAR